MGGPIPRTRSIVITQELLEIARCPTCETGDLRSATGRPFSPDEDGELVCDHCDSRYPVRHNVPALIPHRDLTSAAWQQWEEHLAKFQERRESRIRNPDATIVRVAKKSRPQRPFAHFTGISEGRVLDVGCGPGRFRHNFDLSAVSYFGLDPIVIPESDDFPLIRGLAEYLPFKDGTFTDLVVLAALDHFREPERFFSEARRVLGPDGRLHILQSVHEMRGIVSAIKNLTHVVKDRLEDRASSAGEDVPKHLSEYTEASLREAVGAEFTVDRVDRYSATWYSPDKLFLTATPRES